MEERVTAASRPGPRGAALCLVTQSCPTLCDPLDCSPPGSSVRGDSPGRNTGAGCQALLQGIFPTQGSNPGLLHCRRILYCLSQRGSPRLGKPVAYPFSRGAPHPEPNQGLLLCRRALYQLSCPGSLGPRLVVTWGRALEPGRT